MVHTNLVFCSPFALQVHVVYVVLISLVK